MYPVHGHVFVKSESNMMTVVATFMASYEQQSPGVNMSKSTVMAVERDEI